MEGCRDGKNWCYFHPNQLVIGVCAFCLNQRLLILASNQQHLQPTNTRRRRTPPHIHLPLKIFALMTSSFLNQRKTDLDHHQSSFSAHASSSSSSSNQEESFISIKFEENGAASWEKTTTMAPNNNNKLSVEQYCDMTWNQNVNLKKKEDVEGVVRAVVVVEPRGGGGGAGASLRWPKRIGHLFQLMRWKRSSSSSASASAAAAGAMGNVGTKLEGVKEARHGWIRTLTKQQKKKNKAAGLMCTESRNRCT